ncbi:DUF3426 domain-containing protein [Fodinicurvata sp. EGI_FJ10296]|uniref:DUF3426 domain-containing protein n=1 Tax=Fodinicurvata sp. EGI_FJ10296 TaxID=3231908 RepID=UPI0034549861
MILNCPSCSARYNVDPAKLGSSGRRVRCATCGHVWHQEPIDGSPAPDAGQRPGGGGGSDEFPGYGDSEYGAAGGLPGTGGDDYDVAQPSDTRSGTAGLAASRIGGSARGNGGTAAAQSVPPPAETSTRRGGGAAVLLWILVLGSITVAALYVGRDHVVDTWPPSYRIYQQLGIDVTTPAIAGPGLTVRQVTSERLEGEGQSPPRLVVTGELVNDSEYVRPTPRLMATLFDGGDRTLFDWSFSVERERLEPGESVRFATALDNPDDSATRLEITVADN